MMHQYCILYLTCNLFLQLPSESVPWDPTVAMKTSYEPFVQVTTQLSKTLRGNTTTIKSLEKRLTLLKFTLSW